MSQSVRLTATIVAVLGITSLAGWLLWNNSDPQLVEVEMITDVAAVDSSAEAMIAEDTATGTEPQIAGTTVTITTAETTALAEVASDKTIVTEATAAQDDTTGIDVGTSTESSATESATTDTPAATETVSPAEPIETTETSVLVSATGPGVKELCEVAVTETTTVHKVMLSASDQCGFSYAGKKQGNLGFFVEEIAGLKQSVKDGFYWVFSVNGKKSQLGVSTRTVEPNDTIQWTYEAEY